MKKIILLIAFVAISAISFSQVKVFTDQIITDSLTFDRINWLNGLSNDPTLSAADPRKMVTEFAVKTAIDNLGVPASVIDSILAHTVILQNYAASLQAHLDSLLSHNTRININKAAIKSKQDSITAHTIINQNHETRLDVMEAIDHPHANLDTLNGTTSKFTIALRAALAAAIAKNASQDDSIGWLGDTARIHNDRLKILEAGGGPALPPNTVKYILICTTDTASASPSNTGYFLGIDEDFTGYVLVRAVAMCAGDVGNKTPSVNLYRNRGGVEVAMTSAGASFGDVAAINTSNDDVADGDKLEARWTYSGTGDAPDGLYVIVTLQEP